MVFRFFENNDFGENGLTMRLEEKGGKYLELPAHPKCVESLAAYLDASDIRSDNKRILFRTIAKAKRSPRKQ